MTYATDAERQDALRAAQKRANEKYLATDKGRAHLERAKKMAAAKYQDAKRRRLEKVGTNEN